MSGMEGAAGWMDDPGRNSLGFSLDSFTVFSWEQIFHRMDVLSGGREVSMEMPGRALLHPQLRQEVLVERWPPTSFSKVYHEKLSPLPLSVSEKVAVKVFVGPGLLPSECVSSTDQACLPRHPDALVIFLFFPL